MNKPGNIAGLTAFDAVADNLCALCWPRSVSQAAARDETAPIGEPTNPEAAEKIARFIRSAYSQSA